MSSKPSKNELYGKYVANRDQQTPKGMKRWKHEQRKGFFWLQMKTLGFFECFSGRQMGGLDSHVVKTAEAGQVLRPVHDECM